MTTAWRLSIATLTIACSASLGACVYSRQIRVIQEQHAGATFEATANGCDLARRSVSRTFSELAAAVAWGRGVAAIAPADRTCDVSIDAVSSSSRAAVYLVRRDFKGIWTIAPAEEY